MPKDNPSPRSQPQPPETGNEPLLAGKNRDSSAVDSRSTTITFTSPPAVVSLDSTGQHTLEWAAPLSIGGCTVPPGKLNLYTYPGSHAGAELALLRQVMVELARKSPHLYEVPDPVGAFVIHALVVCNTEASIETALAVLRACPKLVLQQHTGQPFSGEGLLHIACANRREALAGQLIAHAELHCTADELRSFLSTQALGVFFDAPPMCWYGDSPLGCE